MKRSILITAGPTREPIDPVRYLSNRSTGVFGYAIAREARRRGCRTTLISGPVAEKAPRGARLVRVETAAEMRRAVKRVFKGHSHLIMAAAVADWRVERPVGTKMKRKGRPLTLKLVPNPDIVKEVAARKGRRVVAGFALESGNVLREAARKLKEKNLDLVIANKKTGRSDPFGDGPKEIFIIDKAEKNVCCAKGRKEALAKIILDKVLSYTI